MDILGLPTEILQYILVFAHPSDAAAFSRTCHAAAALFTEFQWQEIFLNNFDPPPMTLQGISWQTLLARNWNTQFIAQSQSILADLDSPARAVAIRTLIQMLRDAKRHTTARDDSTSKNIDFVKEALKGSNILDIHPGNLSDTHVLSQLRCFTGFTVTTEARSLSRCFVYNLANYSPTTQWGPANWRHIEHLATVILANLGDLTEPLMPPFDLDSTRGLSGPGPCTLEDWAGVEGTWLRYVCFMDYRDLYTFNYTSTPWSPRLSSIFFERPGFMEATRLLHLKLKISPPEMISQELRERVLEEDPLYPTLCFTGTSDGAYGSGSRIEGCVAMGQDGTVKWYFDAIYEGDARWSSTGFQLGNRASAAGIIGVWTTVLHEEDDPVGPFWMWKVDPSMPIPLIDTT